MRGEPQRMLRIATIQVDGGIKQFHERISKDGETLKLRRLYDFTAGYKMPTQAEQEMLARKLQWPIFMLFSASARREDPNDE